MQLAKIISLVLGGVLLAASPAKAGEFLKGVDGSPLYRFTHCKEPVPAEFRGNREKKIRAYNAHVSAIDAYVVCLQQEAQNDIDAHFDAISAAFHATQTSALDQADAMRKALRLTGGDPGNELVGGPEDPR